MHNRPKDGQYSHCTNEELAAFERKLSASRNDALDKNDEARADWILDCLNLIELEKCRRQPRLTSNIASVLAREIGGAL